MATSNKFASQDPKIVSVYEVVGGFFTDTIFNHIYGSARARLAPGASITDEFRRQTQTYLLAVKNDRTCYTEVVQGVHGYFTGTTRFTTLGFADFVDRIVSTCVPTDYFRQLAPGDKDELLSSIICSLVADLVGYATTPDMLRRIIDGHDIAPEVTIRMMQDAAVEALLTKRSLLLNKFHRKAGQAQEHVSMDIVDDMKKALRRLVKEKAEMAGNITQLDETIADLRRELKDQRAKNAKLLSLVKLLRAGRDRGESAAGAGLLVPADQRAAEPRGLDTHPTAVPADQRVAESRGLADLRSAATVPAADRTAEVTANARSRPASARPASVRPASARVSAGYFNQPSVWSTGDVAAADAPSDPTPTLAPTASSGASSTGVSSTGVSSTGVSSTGVSSQMSPMMASLLAGGLDDEADE